MPVVVIVNPKGGTGKTTLALVIGTVLAEQGAHVTLIDADPNRHLVAWRAGRSKSPVRVRGDFETGRIAALIDEEARSRDLVVVDLEGTASRVITHAVSRADLVLVPLQAASMDASQAKRAVELVREEEAVLARLIPVRLILTRTSPQIPTKAERLVVTELKQAGVPLLKERLHQRQAFGAMFSYRRTLSELSAADVNGLPAAVANAQALAGEIVAEIKTLIARKAA